MYDTWSIEREWKELLEYSQQIFSGWNIKTMLGALIALIVSCVHFYATFFGADVKLVVMLIIAMFLDLLLGILQAKRTGWFSWTKLRKSTPKYVLYSFYLLLIGAASLTIQLAVYPPLGIGIINLVIGYFVAMELVSIAKNFERYTGEPLPYPIHEIIHGVYKKMNRHVDETLDTLNGKDDKSEVVKSLYQEESHDDKD